MAYDEKQVLPDASTEKPARIVIVEDERIVALDIRAHLNRFGYEVVAVYASGEAILENIETDAPDLVLMDIQLQGSLDGVETAERVHRTYDIPVILLTAYADDATIERAKLTQPFAYIIKPFEERELRTAIVIALYRHEMEQKLAAREQLLDTTLNSITDGVLVCDSERRINYANPLACTMSGRSEDEIIGAVFDDVYPLQADQDDPDHVSRHTGEFVLTRRDGSMLPVEITETGLSDDREKAGPKGRVLVLRDLSERRSHEQAIREREDQLRQAQKMEAVGRLSGGIAHDFNNLLTVMLGYSKLIVEGLNSSKGMSQEEILTDIEGIQKAAYRSVGLTRQLLAFSRNQVIDPKTLSMNTIIADVEKMLTRLLDDTIRLQVVPAPENPSVLVDQGQMEQVLLNLVVNARDAMSEGGTITVSVHGLVLDEVRRVTTGELSPGKWVIVKVRDTGHGIPEDDHTRIFEPFYSTKSIGKGTGLGLATVYGIVRQLEGHIHVDSQPEQGTVFSVFLPESTGERHTEEEERTVHVSLTGTETVLLVEDETPVRDLVARILLQHGYKVISAQNAGEALLISEESGASIDLLVTDVLMPHVTGITLAQRLMVAIPAMKVLLITGYAEELAALKSDERKLGLPVLQKPFEPSELLQTVRKILDS
ncbi:MAG: response regulator [Spirochaetaceae bacterium]|nr:MAG: response regulator [Spirochaetaceae bacterium]